MSQREVYGNDRNEIYDRRDSKKKRRDWKEKRHQDGRQHNQQRPTRDYEQDEDDGEVEFS